MDDTKHWRQELLARQILLEAENEGLRKELKMREEESAARIVRLQMIALQSQIKPHFMYNALSAIIALCYTDGERAAELLTKFSRYLRILFTMDPQEEMVTLQKILELIEMVVEIDKSRFGDRLKIFYEVDPTLMEAPITPLLLEPLIENAIRHGVSKKIQGGTIHLRIRRFGTFMKVTVADNGVGMSPDQVHAIMARNETAIGLGIPNINKRLLLYSGKKLRIRSVEGVGTIVVMLLPLREGGQSTQVTE